MWYSKIDNLIRAQRGVGSTLILAVCLLGAGAVLGISAKLFLSKPANDLTVTAQQQQPARETIDKSQPLPLPPGSGAWMIKLTTGGGITGSGVGDVIVTSAGDLFLDPPRHHGLPGKLWRNKLSAERLQGITRLVVSAKPDAWRARYVDPARPGGCGDDLIENTLALHRRRADGAEQVSTAFWYESCPTPFSKPSDLLQIYQAAYDFRGEL